MVFLRGALLAALALFLGGVVAVFLANRIKPEGNVEAEAGNDLELNLAETLLSGRGFDYEVTDGERRLYHIRADRIVANRDKVITLTGVVITVERASGEVYELAAKKGTYRSNSGTAVTATHNTRSPGSRKPIVSAERNSPVRRHLIGGKS